MKRFTATEKWEKPWFQDLPPHLKCLWQFMCDKCDCAGVWEMNWKAATMFIGKAVSASDLKHFIGRVAVFGNKLVIAGFVEFQYGKLSDECRAHIPIFRTLEKHRLSIGYSKAIHSLKEEEEEEEKDQETEKEGESAERGAESEPKAKRSETLLFTMPEELDNAEFREAWERWAEYRRQARLKAYTAIGGVEQLAKLARWGSARAIAAIRNSMANSYQGIYEPKGEAGKARPLHEDGWEQDRQLREVK